MQRSNVLLFILLLLTFLAVYIPFRQRIFPTPARPAPGNEEEAAVAAKKDEPKRNDQPIRLPLQPSQTPDKDLYSLGSVDTSSKYHIQAVLDPLGGGLRGVTLNKFRSSDADGRPAEGPLELVPAEANRHTPSHLLYHFSPNDTDWDARPLDTLGRRQWTVVTPGGKGVEDSETESGQACQRVAFQTEVDGVRITKTYTLAEGDYHVGLEVRLEQVGKGKGQVPFRYQLTGAKGLPIEGKWYTGTFRNALIGLQTEKGYIERDFQELRQLDLWQGGKAIDRKEGTILRYAGIAVQYFASVIVVDNQQPEDNQRILRRATPSLETGVAKGRVKGPANLGDTDRLILTNDDGKSRTIYLPQTGAEGLRAKLAFLQDRQQIAVLYRSLSYDEKLKECPHVAIDIRVGAEAEGTHAMWEDDITVRVATDPVKLTPGGEPVVHKYLLYNGPVKPSLLRQLRGDRDVSDALVARYVDDLKLNTLTDYQSPGGMGSFAAAIGWTSLVIKCTNLMHWVLSKMHLVIPSFGLSIILLTVLVRLIMFPLSRKQALMSVKMQALQPELKKLAEKYKNDRQEYATQQMALFRKHKVNPVGSCWVVLLQMPIFMGLYFALQESIQFRLASFWPTWIVNLAAPDMLLHWGRSIPLLSRDGDYGGMLYLGPYFNLLPMFAVGLMVLQQMLMMPPPADKEQEMQQKMMRWMMIVFGLFFYKIAAGLCIYIITSTIWGFAERKLLPKAKLGGVTDTDSSAAGTLALAGDSPLGSTSTAIKTAGSLQGQPPARKNLRGKRKGERGRGREAEIENGEGSLMERLKAWWENMLEQARKK